MKPSLAWKRNSDEHSAAGRRSRHSSADWIDTEDGRRVLNGAHVNRARLMIDTRKWLLSKMLPKGYGDHLTVAGDPDQPIQRIVHQIDWAALSDEEIEAIEMFARAVERRQQTERGVRPELGTDSLSDAPHRRRFTQ
jgi:hypothetical protein